MGSLLVNGGSPRKKENFLLNSARRLAKAIWSDGGVREKTVNAL